MRYQLGETKIIVDETFCSGQKQEEINQMIKKNIYERVLRWIWAEEKTNLAKDNESNNAK